MVLKRLFLIFLIVIILLTLMILISCSTRDNPNAEIQLWYYDYGSSKIDYNIDASALIKSIEEFCRINNIPLKIVKYGKSTLSYEDYELKRNLAAANGNMIIIEDPRRIWDISKDHADYTKLENYENLLYPYKNRFCIPIGVCHIVQHIQGDILNYYDIEPNKSIITYNDYLDIKQEMKENGAKFAMNYYEYMERCDYYLIKNGLRLVNNDSKILKDSNKFRIALKSSIIESIDDIIKYNSDDSLDESNNYRFNIYDKNSELNIYDYRVSSAVLTSYYLLPISFEDQFDGNVAFVSPNTNRAYSPCFYMHKKITNLRIYEIANYIVSEDGYKVISRTWAPDFHIYSPVFKGEITKEIMNLDENFKYNGDIGKLVDIAKVGFKDLGVSVIGENESGDNDSQEIIEGKYNKIRKHIDDVFEFLIKDDEALKIVTDYYFANEDYVDSIKKFVIDTTIYFLENNIYYKNNEEENKKLDSMIDEFVSNFNIHFK